MQAVKAVSGRRGAAKLGGYRWVVFSVVGRPLGVWCPGVPAEITVRGQSCPRRGESEARSQAGQRFLFVLGRDIFSGEYVFA